MILRGLLEEVCIPAAGGIEPLPERPLQGRSSPVCSICFLVSQWTSRRSHPSAF